MQITMLNYAKLLWDHAVQLLRSLKDEPWFLANPEERDINQQLSRSDRNFVVAWKDAVPLDFWLAFRTQSGAVDYTHIQNTWDFCYMDGREYLSIVDLVRSCLSSELAHSSYLTQKIRIIIGG